VQDIALILLRDPKALWFLNRGTGYVLLAMLTLTLVLGVLASSRQLPSWWPRFVGNELHRRVALLSLSFLVVHIAAAVLDSFVDISIFDSVLPFQSPYRPIWLGLGTVALDLFIAVLITTGLRSRMTEMAWRSVHVLTYPAWALAVLHGLGTGTDTQHAWALWTNAACAGVVLASLTYRLATASTLSWPVRGGLIAAAVAVPLGIVVWTVQGPLAPGWSHRVGTPAPKQAAK
jgi:sulfoxide reductase heme-binding subunit YedZ